MSEPKKRGAGWAVWVAVGCVVLPVLYVLSLGPACWLTEKRVIPFAATKAAYRPLVRAIRSMPQEARDMAQWYCGRSNGLDMDAAMLDLQKLSMWQDDKVRFERTRENVQSTPTSP